MKKTRVISFVVVLCMILSVFTSPAFVLADTEAVPSNEDLSAVNDSVSDVTSPAAIKTSSPELQSVHIPENVNLRVEYMDSTYIPLQEVDISEYKTLEQYGVKGVEEKDEAGYITPMHVLAECMERTSGQDPSNITMSGGFLSNINDELGDGEYFMFRVNDEYVTYPDDSGNGYLLTDYPVKDNDEITIYAIKYPDTEAYGFFDKPEYKAVVNSRCDVKLKGDYSSYGSPDIKPVSDAEIYISDVNSKTADNASNVYTDNDGVASIVFDKTGTYVLSAVKHGLKSISRPYCTVKVTEGDDESNRRDVEKDKEDLQIPEVSEDSAVKIDKLTLKSVGANGSVITWTTSDDSIIDNKGNVFRSYEEDKTVTLTAELKKGLICQTKEFTLKVAKKGDLDAAIELNKIITEDLDGYRPSPVYGVDTNIIDVVKGRLKELGYDNIGVTIKSTSNPEAIDKSGHINYYKDMSSVTALGKFYQVSFIFTFSLNGIEQDWSPSLTTSVYWDRAAVEAQIQTKEVNKVTWDLIKGENLSQSEVKKDIELPGQVESADPKLSNIEWISSNPDVIAIEEKGSTYLSKNYVGKITKPVDKEADVYLDAVFEFRFTSLNESEIYVHKTFLVKVPPIDENDREAIKKDLQNRIDETYSTDVLKYMDSDTTIKSDNEAGGLIWDISMPTSRSGGYAVGTPKEQGEIRANFKSSDENVLKINGYRIYVYRPLPGEETSKAVLTVTLTQDGVNVSKDIEINAVPLTLTEIEKDTKLMEKVKEKIFEGIKGDNTAADEVRTNLHSFQEVSFNGDETELNWIHNYNDTQNIGLKPVQIDLDAEGDDAYTTFASDKTTVIAPMSLLVYRQNIDTNVTITTCMSSIRLERYGEKYPDNELFRPVLRQKIEIPVVVKALGDDPVGPNPPGEEVPEPCLNSLVLKFRTQTSNGVDQTEVNFEFKPERTKYTVLTDELYRRMYVNTSTNDGVNTTVYNGNYKASEYNGVPYISLSSFGSNNNQTKIEVNDGANTTTYTVDVVSKKYMVDNLSALPDPDDENVTDAEITSNKYMIERLAEFYDKLDDEQKSEVDSDGKIKKLNTRMLLAPIKDKLEQYTPETTILDDRTSAHVDLTQIKTGTLKLKNEGNSYYSDFDYSWTSSNENIISITAGAYYDKAQVTRPEKGNDSEKVTLTLTLYDKDNPGIYLSKDFDLTVVPVEDSEILEAEELLKSAEDETYFIFAEGEDKDSAKSKFSVNMPDNSIRDKVDIKFKSSNESLIKVSSTDIGADVTVNRPDLYQKDAGVKITATFTHENLGLKHVKEFDLTVLSYKENEISSEYKFLKEIKDNLFEGIKGQNISPDHITDDLVLVTGANKNEDGTIDWKTNSEEEQTKIAWIATTDDSYISVNQWSSPLSLKKRPDEGEKDKIIKLTARISSNQYGNKVPAVTADIELTVKAYNMYLAGLNIDGVENLDFKKDTLQYEVLTNASFLELPVTAEPEGQDSVMKINGAVTESQKTAYVTLIDGCGEIKIEVSNTCGYNTKTRTYIVRVFSKRYLEKGISELPSEDDEILKAEEEIKSLYEQYSKLSEENKKQINGGDKLEAIYIKMAELKEAAEKDAIIKEMNDYLDKNYSEDSAVEYETGDDKNSVTKDLTLKKESSYYSEYSLEWVSSDDSVVSVKSSWSSFKGNVKRPGYDVSSPDNGDKHITLTLTLKNKDDIEVSRDFVVMVKALNEEDTASINNELEQKLNDIYLSYEDDDSSDSVTKKFKCKTDSSSGYNVIWTSDREDVISIDDGYTIYGEVNRPYFDEGNKSVKITAEISKDGSSLSKTKEFDLTVISLSEEESSKIKSSIDDALKQCKILDGINEENTIDLDSVVTSKLKLMTPSIDGVDVDWSVENDDSGSVGGIPYYGDIISVTRPSLGKPDGKAVFTVAVTHKDSGKKQSKDISVTVKAITQIDYDQELEFLESVSNALGKAVLNENKSFDYVVDDLKKIDHVTKISDGSFNWDEEDIFGRKANISWDLTENDASQWISDTLALKQRPAYGEEDKKVILTARIKSSTFEDLETTKEIAIVIKPYTNEVTDIKVNGKIINGFKPDKYDYFVEVDKYDTSADVSVTVADPAICLKLGGIVNIESGKTQKIDFESDKDTVVEINSSVAVTNDDKIYSITFHRPDVLEGQAEWPMFRGFENNMGIISAKTPANAAEAELKWAEQLTEGWSDYSSNIIIAENNIFVAVNNKLLKFNKNGKQEQEIQLSGTISYNTHIAYGEGKIFVPFDNGKVEAVNTSAMKSVWVSEPITEGEKIYYAASPVLYDDGYIYTGTSEGWSSNSGYYFCLSAEDGTLKWNKNSSGKGYYWAGAVSSGNVVIYGNDSGTLLSVNKSTGETVDSYSADEAIRSTVSTDKGTIYFTTKNGTLYSIKVNDDGSFDKDLIKSNKITENAVESTSTPLVYNGRIYVGAKTEDAGELGILSSDSLDQLYSLPLKGNGQSSPLLTKAYESENKVYVYMTYNNNPGGITVVTDYKDGKEPKARELYIPDDNKKNYCLSSVIADDNGNLYYKNDSGYLFAVKRQETKGSLVSINSVPENSSVKITDKDGNIVSEKFDGIYVLPAGIYNYEVSKEGYVTKKGSFEVTKEVADAKEEITIYVSLVKKSEQSENITVKFTLRGDTKHGEPENHKAFIYWIKRVRVTVPKGSSAFDVFDKALTENGFTYKEKPKNYIKSITIPSSLGGYTLSEFDNGLGSGWMYTVNNDWPDWGMRSQTVKNGDCILFYYTDEYNKEPPAEKWNSSSGSNSTAPENSGKVTFNEGGNVEPKGDLSDKIGKDVKFTFEPKEGYTIKDVIVDGKSIGAVDSYMYENLREDSTVEVVFEKIDLSEETVEFNDLEGFKWAERSIKKLVEQGIFKGRSQGTFAPKDNLTRAEFATLIVRATKVPETEDSSIGFKDIAADAWYAKAVKTAFENGFMRGKSDNIFDASGNITRQEFAVAVSNVLKSLGYESEEKDYLKGLKDSENIAPWARDGVKLAVQYGLIIGDEEENFNPSEYMTRAEAAVVMERLLNLIQ